MISWKKMRSRVLILGAMFLASMPAAADQFYLAVSLHCDVAKPELQLVFRGAWNEAADQLLAGLGPNDVDPRTLVTMRLLEGTRYAIDTRHVQKHCRMGEQDYVVDFAPLMAPRFHPEGFCATRIGAEVSVRLRDRVIASAGVDACTQEGRVTKSISLSPGREASYEVIDAAQFYRD